MAWTDTARRQHMRNGPGYPSDLRDGEWALIEPMLPPARSGGRPRTTRLRAVMDAIMYIASSGCAWRMLPKCFPPISTVRGYFYDWRDSGLLTTINCGKRAGVPTEVADKVKALEREVRDLRQVTGERTDYRWPSITPASNLHACADRHSLQS